MGHAYAELELSNPRRPELAPVRVTALADTDSNMLCLPERIVAQLDLEVDSYRDIYLADGRAAHVPYVGPIKVTFLGRTCFVGAFMMGDEPLLGAVPMEDLDVVVLPKEHAVVPNPKHPNGPLHRV